MLMSTTEWTAARMRCKEKEGSRFRVTTVLKMNTLPKMAGTNLRLPCLPGGEVAMLSPPWPHWRKSKRHVLRSSSMTFSIYIRRSTSRFCQL